MRRHLTYANVMATIALFFALAGGSYAATQLTTNSVGPTQLRKSAVTGRAIKDNSIKGADVDESSLAKVPSAKAADRATTAGTATTAASAASAQHASTADTATSAGSAATATSAATAANAAALGGLAANAYVLRCPAGTRALWGACLELDAHAPATPLDALADCSARGGRLPSWLELTWVSRQSDIVWAQGQGSMQYELTGESGNATNVQKTVLAIDRVGNKDNATADATTYRYRCVLAKVNG